ncbi:MAG: TlpA family protein disulfide reductase [Campylobacteraceae bacterium]|nr:TlpA family protein disulfide reductase [Campylobacteraceae bacterium]
MKNLIIFISMIFILAFAGCKDKTSKPLVQDDKVELSATNGDKITIKKTANGLQYTSDKALLLTFFTTSCVPCKAQIPHLNNLQAHYADELRIVAVMLDNTTLEEVQSFITDTKIEFIVTYDNNNFKLSATLGNITNVPYTAIYDKNGDYAAHYVGAAPEEMIEADLKRIF